ncbi:MAG TPA: hypothetical protein VKQ52_10810, partial [Puia sp.]|nr:hypothetical protein [Puia sp.]
MPKPVLAIGLLALVFFGACKKDHSVSPFTFTIKLVSGGGQTDTIGNVLKNQLSFLATQGNGAVRDGYLRFETMTANNTIQYTDYHLQNSPQANPIPLFNYAWQLNQTVGTQTLKVILFDSVMEPKDSLTVNATALATSAGWHITSSIPIGTFCVAFGQLPSGRVFTATNKQDYPYYSDDDGGTWHAITTFPMTAHITSIAVSKDNEVFMAVPNIGVYYSQDKGRSWQLRDNNLPLQNYGGSLQCTASGTLLLETVSGPYYSTDKGQTWNWDGQGLLNGAGPAPELPVTAFSMTDGTILAALNGYVVKSTNGG